MGGGVFVANKIGVYVLLVVIAYFLWKFWGNIQAMRGAQ